MKDIRLLLLVFRKSQSIKTRIRERLVVVARLIAGSRRNGFDAHAKQIMRKRLKKWQRLRRQLAMLHQIIGIADFPELRELLLFRKVRKIVDLFSVNTCDITPNDIGK